MIAAFAFLIWPGLLTAQSSPNELVRRVIDNELSAENQDHSHWMFRLEKEDRSGQKEVDEVVETKDGDLVRPILRNGRELPAKQRQESDRQLGRNPQGLRKTQKEKKEDADRSQQMLKMLPEAFTFSPGERRGDLEELHFRPNSTFHARSHEAEVFHAMEGDVWLDVKQNRLAEISGHLIEAVKFAGGVLGHLDKGGTFHAKQEEVAPGYWELTVLNVQMKGKALFFKTISVHQNIVRMEFKRVPDDLTIAQAAELLKKAAHNSSVSAPALIRLHEKRLVEIEQPLLKVVSRTGEV